MTGQRLILSVDIGTSGARAVLLDSRASHLWHIRKPYGMIIPYPGWGEQDPDMVADAVIEALKATVAALPPDSILEGIVFCSQLYSILAVDSACKPLSNSLMWADNRSVSQAADVRRTASSDLSRRTGCPIQPLYPLTKILWLKANLELPRDAKFVAIKDYVLFRLTGQLVADWATASASGLVNVSTCQWDAEALQICGLTEDNLPDLVSTRRIIRKWRTDVSRYIGIPADTPLIVGAGDASVANIGVGAITDGTLAVNVGTSAATRVLTTQPQVDPAGRLWTYVADVDHWIVGGVIGSGGAVYEWLLQKLLFPEREVTAEELFREADRLAESVPPGADDLLFLPYFSGEQSPGWNPASRGLVYGMTYRHEPRHYIRAAIEGIAFALLRAAKPIEEVRGVLTRKIYLTGGASMSPVWRGIVASVFGASVVIPRSSESSARGAAVLGWLALGHAAKYEDFIQPEDYVQPDDALVDFYRQRFKAFCSLNLRLNAKVNDEEIF